MVTLTNIDNLEIVRRADHVFQSQESLKFLTRILDVDCFSSDIWTVGHYLI